MPYIDAEYYKTTYNGKMPADPDSLPRIISRASDQIDILTGYKIRSEADFLRLHEFQQSQVKKATAVLVEFYIMNGGPEIVYEPSVQSATIGSFSFTSSAGENVSVPSDVASFLSHSGLLYAGID